MKSLDSKKEKCKHCNEYTGGVCPWHLLLEQVNFPDLDIENRFSK